MEESDFHYRVYDGYKKIAENNPERVKRIDATRSVEEISEEIVNYLEEICEKRGL